MTTVTMTLDEAWAKVEAALPDGWQILELKNTGYRVSRMGEGERWLAMASPAERDYSIFRSSYGDTPVAALRALAISLGAER